jgi:hypothetical protein
MERMRPHPRVFLCCLLRGFDAAPLVPSATVPREGEETSKGRVGHNSPAIRK